MEQPAQLEAARCPGCHAVGIIGSAAWGAGWWFYCRACAWGWGHPQSYTLDTALDAIDAARAGSGVGTPII